MTTKSIVLPRGKIGVTFDGAPPVVIRVLKNSPVYDEVTEGLYAQTLIVPGCEISFIPYAAWLYDVLKHFEQVDRTLVLRDAPMTGPPLWIISLPTGPLGIHMKGFPPVITLVNADSKIKELVQEGVIVDRLVVPNICDLSLGVGGFTDTRVIKTLRETQNVEGRQLVLKAIDIRQAKKRTPLFDFGAFKPARGWGLNRMANKGGKGFL